MRSHGQRQRDARPALSGCLRGWCAVAVLLRGGLSRCLGSHPRSHLCSAFRKGVERLVVDAIGRNVRRSAGRRLDTKPRVGARSSASTVTAGRAGSVPVSRQLRGRHPSGQGGERGGLRRDRWCRPPFDVKQREEHQLGPVQPLHRVVVTVPGQRSWPRQGHRVAPFADYPRRKRTHRRRHRREQQQRLGALRSRRHSHLAGHLAFGILVRLFDRIRRRWLL